MYNIKNEQNKTYKNDWDNSEENIRKIKKLNACPRCGTYLEVLDDIKCPHCNIPIIWIKMYVAMKDEKNEE